MIVLAVETFNFNKGRFLQSHSRTARLVAARTAILQNYLVLFFYFSHFIEFYFYC